MRAYRNLCGFLFLVGVCAAMAGVAGRVLQGDRRDKILSGSINKNGFLFIIFVSLTLWH